MGPFAGASRLLKLSYILVSCLAASCVCLRTCPKQAARAVGRRRKRNYVLYKVEQPGGAYTAARNTAERF